MKAVTAAQMREIDRQTIETYLLPGSILMENAGRAVAEAVAEITPGPEVLIIAGKGNNGGDGFVAARHLAEAGYFPQVALLAAAADLSGDAASNYRYLLEFDVTVHEHPTDELLADLFENADAIVDAVLGTGIKGAVKGRAAAVLSMMADFAGPVIAVDIPSGVNADTGVLLGDVATADITVTFGLAKQGLYLYPGRAYCGEIRVANIGLAPAAIANPAFDCNVTTVDDVIAMLPPRAADAHKGDAGRLLVVAGSVGFTGAAAMAAMAAARAGAGLVTLACPATLNSVLEAKCTEVMTAPVADLGTGYFHLASLTRILEMADVADAVVIGPGLGTSKDTAQLIRDLMVHIETPVLIDADGINAFAAEPQMLAECPAEVILTPHPGELARLTGQSIAEIQADRIATAQETASVLNATVLLKGAGTVTASSTGEAWINTTGNSGMASGGMGDILSGIIGAFVAGGADPVEAAVAGAYVHGAAADITAEVMGPRGYIASDLLHHIPQVFAKLS